MSTDFNPLNTTFDELQDAINDCQSDVTKFVEAAINAEKFADGNNSAGTRVRKTMQNIKNLAQAVRTEVQEQKNSVPA